MHVLQRKTGGVFVTPFGLNFKDDGFATAFCDSGGGIFPQTLYKLVQTRGGHRAAPLISPADAYFVAAFNRVNARSGISEAVVGGSMTVIIRQDLEPGFAHIEDGKVVTRQSGPDFRLRHEFGYIEPISEDTYNVEFMPFMVVEYAALRHDFESTDPIENDEDGGE